MGSPTGRAPDIRRRPGRLCDWTLSEVTSK